MSILEYLLVFFPKQLHAALILAYISSFVVSLRCVVCPMYLNSVTFSIFCWSISMSSLSAWFVMYFVFSLYIFKPTFRLSEFRLFLLSSKFPLLLFWANPVVGGCGQVRSERLWSGLGRYHRPGFLVPGLECCPALRLCWGLAGEAAWLLHECRHGWVWYGLWASLGLVWQSLLLWWRLVFSRISVLVWLSLCSWPSSLSGTTQRSLAFSTWCSYRRALCCC